MLLNKLLYASCMDVGNGAIIVKSVLTLTYISETASLVCQDTHSV